MPEEDLPSAEPRNSACGLARFEKEIIALMMSGYPTAEIAAKLGMGLSGLQQYIEELFDRFSVSNELELILFAIYHSILEKGD